MNYSLKSLKKTVLAVLAGGLLSLMTGVFVHAQTVDTTDASLAFAFPSFKTSLENNIWSDRQNVIKNRDARNALLEASMTSSSSTEVSQELSLSLSELENIESRIDARTADAAAAGDDISTVTSPLAMADQELNIASTTLMSIGTAASSTDTATNTAAQALDSAKISLEEALAALKVIVGN